MVTTGGFYKGSIGIVSCLIGGDLLAEAMILQLQYARAIAKSDKLPHKQSTDQR